MTSYVKSLCFIVAIGFGLTQAFAGQNTTQTIAMPQQTTPQTKGSQMSDSELDISSQFPGDWRITLVSGEVIAPELGLSMTLDIGTAQIFTGCNTATATHHFAVANSGFEVTGITKKACEPEIMERETKLMDAISKVQILTSIGGTALAFYDADNRLVLAATNLDP